MSATVEDLKEAFFQKEVAQLSENWLKYQSILKRLSDGKKVVPDEVAPVLELVGRTINDLPSDLQNYAHRIATRKRAEEAASAKLTLQETLVELEKLKAEKQAYLDAVVPKIEALATQRDTLTAIVNSGVDVPNELYRSCRNPGLLKELHAIDAELRTLSERERDIAFASQRTEPSVYAQELHSLQTNKSVLSRRRSEVVAKMESE
jgi:hypothetical protein